MASVKICTRFYFVRIRSAMWKGKMDAGVDFL